MASTATTPRHRVTDAPTGRGTWWALAAFLVATAVAAGLGGAASSSAGSEYESLELPFFAPPSAGAVRQLRRYCTAFPDRKSVV